MTHMKVLQFPPVLLLQQKLQQAQLHSHPINSSSCINSSSSHSYTVVNKLFLKLHHLPQLPHHILSLIKFFLPPKLCSFLRFNLFHLVAKLSRLFQFPLLVEKIMQQQLILTRTGDG
jgi:hypothetical protein